MSRPPSDTRATARTQRTLARVSEGGRDIVDMIVSVQWQARERGGKAGGTQRIQEPIKPRPRGPGNIQFRVRPSNAG